MASYLPSYFLHLPPRLTRLHLLSASHLSASLLKLSPSLQCLPLSHLSKPKPHGPSSSPFPGGCAWFFPHRPVFPSLRSLYMPPVQLLAFQTPPPASCENQSPALQADSQRAPAYTSASRAGVCTNSRVNLLTTVLEEVLFLTLCFRGGNGGSVCLGRNSPRAHSQ